MRNTERKATQRELKYFKHWCNSPALPWIEVWQRRKRAQLKKEYVPDGKVRYVHKIGDHPINCKVRRLEDFD